MNKIVLKEREKKIIDKIIEEGEYSLYLSGTDICLSCIDNNGEYFVTAENCSIGEIIDSKIISLRKAASILAKEDEIRDEMFHNNFIETGLTAKLCESALNMPFISQF